MLSEGHRADVPFDLGLSEAGALWPEALWYECSEDVAFMATSHISTA